MSAHRYGVVAAAAIVILVAAGCAQAGRDSRGVPPPVPASRGASDGPGPSGPSGSTGPGAPVTGGSGYALAGPVPLSSVSCGVPEDTTLAPLPDRTWVEVAWCPAVPPIRTGTDHAAPPGQPAPPTITRGDLGPLLAALRQPDAARSTDVCPLYRLLLPTFWLVDGGNDAYQPRLPVGPCGQPSQAVTDAVRALGLH